MGSRLEVELRDRLAVHAREHLGQLGGHRLGRGRRLRGGVRRGSLCGLLRSRGLPASFDGYDGDNGYDQCGKSFHEFILGWNGVIGRPPLLPAITRS
jgi:hypothetical protein